MAKHLVFGYISVKSIIEAKSREIYEIILDGDRYQKVQSSNYHVNEKRQYAALERSTVKITRVSAEAFQKLNPGQTAGGIAAYVGERRYQTLEHVLENKAQYYTILDGIEDPYNFGNAIRSIYAAGVDVLIIPERDYYEATDIIVRASAGASELITTCVSKDIESDCKTLKDHHINLYATAKTDNAKDVRRVRIQKPLCIIYGGEKRGISSNILSLCNQVIKIKYPRDCHYSLPAVNAVSILSFEIGYRIKADAPTK